MNFDGIHTLLVRGKEFSLCRERVEKFFARNFLVKYDAVEVVTAKSYSAADPGFWPALKKGIHCNRQQVTELIKELQEAGFETINDLGSIPQGYESKVLHTITHLVDGFFGVDTCFYNLEEDSHGLTSRLEATIKADPTNFWLLSVTCSSTKGHNSDQLAMIRKFDVAPPES